MTEGHDGLATLMTLMAPIVTEMMMLSSSAMAVAEGLPEAAEEAVVAGMEAAVDAVVAVADGVVLLSILVPQGQILLIEVLRMTQYLMQIMKLQIQYKLNITQRKGSFLKVGFNLSQ